MSRSCLQKSNMKKFSLLICLSLFTSQIIFAQLNISAYSAVSLPEVLKKDANAIYRIDEEEIEISSPSKYTSHVHQVVTLLNEQAAHLLNQNFLYNKFHRVENIEIKIYNSDGLMVNQYHKKDFKSRDYDDRMSLYTDEKVLSLQTAAPAYPCTVEITYNISANGYVSLPNWYISEPDVAVENSKFIISVPASLDINHREVRTSIKPEINIYGDKKVYTWEAKNVPAIKVEKDSYEAGNYMPEIEITPNEFEYDGYKGEFKNWQTFGAWNYQFYEQNKNFSKEKNDEIIALVSNCKTDKEKVSVLYKYMQKAMRYVSIQLGIGGFKPFSVQYVEDNKYGDCKALTNYMRYLLKAVGIRSYPALINAGYNKAAVDPGFPTDPFNHVILCVPFKKDSIWLECTSNNNEFGILGNFTENRNALLLTENGGFLVPTPKSNSKNNVLNSKTIIELNDDGGSKAVSEIYCKGDFSNLFYEVMQQNSSIQKEIFINYFHYRAPDDFNFLEKPDSATGKAFGLNMSYDQQYDFKAGSKYFFRSRINTLCSEDVKENTRTTEYVFDFPYTKIDTTIFILPAGVTVESLPAKKDIHNSYCSYKNNFIKSADGRTITAIAEFSIIKKSIPPEDYLQTAEFFSQVKESENEKIILKKN